ncbi:MAG: hypothetical protein QG652_655, partial [Pseudomonadota bacterium]|nr:hypothetical protein [Pseudomonadota bacterium]
FRAAENTDQQSHCNNQKQKFFECLHVIEQFCFIGVEWYPLMGYITRSKIIL